MTNRDQVERLTECIRIAQKAAFRDPMETAKRVDSLFADRKQGVIVSIAMAHERLSEFCKVFTSDQEQYVTAALLLAKCQNDILAGYHLLRSGYNMRAIYFIRLGCESICQAVLCFQDDVYLRLFQEDSIKASADSSIQRVKNAPPLSGLRDKDNAYLKSLCERKGQMNRHSHSTIYALKGDEVNQAFSLGPSYDPAKADEYRSIEHEYAGMANLVCNLAGWMKKQVVESDE